MRVDTLTTVPDDRRCNATTRAGTPCRRWTARGRTRCRLHGGATPHGDASPHLKHGWYSTDPMYVIRRQMVESYERKQASVAAYLEAHGFRQDADGEWMRDTLASYGIDLDTP